MSNILNSACVPDILVAQQEETQVQERRETFYGRSKCKYQFITFSEKKRQALLFY